MTIPEGTFDSQKILTKTILPRNLFVFSIEFASGMRLHSQVPTPRTAEDEEQLDLEPAKAANTATSSRRLVPTTNRE